MPVDAAAFFLDFFFDVSLIAIFSSLRHYFRFSRRQTPAAIHFARRRH